jgi:hypothetical protein
MQIFIGFRPNHIKLRAEHIEGRIGLVIELFPNKG